MTDYELGRSDRSRFMARELGLKLCEIWGLDPRRVADITLELHPQEAAKATVVMFLERRDLPQMIDEFEKFSLQQARVTFTMEGEHDD